MKTGKKDFMFVKKFVVIFSVYSALEYWSYSSITESFSNDGRKFE